jgi:DNA-binding XRE family transcriptional regulator
MPVAEKTRRIKNTRKLISVSGEAAAAILAYAKRKDPQASIVQDSARANSSEHVPAQSAKWYRDVKVAWHPGVTLRIRRENAGLTQAQLARLTGLAVSNISAIENGRRPVGLAVAKKLADALGRPVSEFVEPTS